MVLSFNPHKILGERQDFLLLHRRGHQGLEGLCDLTQVTPLVKGGARISTWPWRLRSLAPSIFLGCLKLPRGPRGAHDAPRGANERVSNSAALPLVLSVLSPMHKRVIFCCILGTMRRQSRGAGVGLPSRNKASNRLSLLETQGRRGTTAMAGIRPVVSLPHG